jgi:HK97 family phage portal protein
VLADLLRAARPRTTASVRVPSGSGTLAGMHYAGAGTWATWDPTLVVTDDEALGLPVVSAFLETTTALAVQMGLHAWQGGQPTGTDPPILRNPTPGPNRTLVDFIGEYVRALALRGNYVAVLGDDGWTGWPEVLYPIPAGQWSVEQDATTGEVIYTIGGARYPARDVFHVARGCEPGELVGRGLLDTHPQLLASAVTAERWAAKYFSTGAAPPAVLRHPDPDLTQAQADMLKVKYNTATRNREALIVPAGTDVDVVASDAEKAQLADTRKANDVKLAIACGIPGALLGLEGPSLTYRNITDVFQQYLTTTVVGTYLRPLEEQLSLSCLPRGTDARFATAAVLRPDLGARVTIAVQGYGGGLLTLNEGRALLDLPPLALGATPAPRPATAVDVAEALTPPDGPAVEPGGAPALEAPA